MRADVAVTKMISKLNTLLHKYAIVARCVRGVSHIESWH